MVGNNVFQTAASSDCLIAQPRTSTSKNEKAQANEDSRADVTASQETRLPDYRGDMKVAVDGTCRQRFQLL